MNTMMVRNGMYNSYSRIASGKRINSAADDAAGLAIAQKLKKQEKGLNVGAENAKDGMGVMNVADGALGGIMDQLQRMRELGVKSMNGLYSDSEREIFQREIDGLKQGIQSLAKDTTLNEQNLLDGSMADMHLATNPDGGGMQIRMANATLESLGIADFDVTSGNFDLSAIDKAMEKVSGQRSNMGAYTNRLEHTYNYNTASYLEQSGARSRIEDLDMPKAISEKKKEDLMKEYRINMLRKQMDQESLITRMFR